MKRSFLNYIAFKGTMGRKPFIAFSLGGYVGLSLLFIVAYIASLTPAEYAALKDYQDTVGNGILPNGYGFADPMRFLLSLFLLPAVVLRLRDCGKPLFWLILFIPSTFFSAWALIERPLPMRYDVQALSHVLFYFLLFVLMLKKTRKDTLK